MQTFLPYADFKKTFKVLDYRRLGKQRLEALTLIHVIEGWKKDGEKSRGWINHPITIMWKPYLNALKLYYNKCIEEWVNRGYNNTMQLFSITNSTIQFPKWLGYEPFHASHRSNLLRKEYEYYIRFGWDENSKDPYLWQDASGQWYSYNSELKRRIYLQNSNKNI
jgi:hypothetical protein